MGAGRKWTNQTYPTLVDWLDCPAGITTPPPSSKMTFAAWVLLPTDITQAAYGLWVGPAFWIQINTNTGGTDGSLSLIRGIFGDYQATSPNFSTLGLGDLSGKAIFFAVSSNSVGISFFAGLSPDSVVNWGVDVFGPNWQSFGPFPSYLGEAVAGGSVKQFYGTISHAALWWGQQLTLAELQDFAGSCDSASALTDLSTFYYPITGDSPEPDYSLGGNPAVVHGTTVVDSICGGSGFSRDLIAEFF